MIEKSIVLENLSLVDFLGVENRNIKAINKAFPKCKILSRGNEIKLSGEAKEILQISELIKVLIAHFDRYGKISPDIIEEYLKQEARAKMTLEDDQIIVYGNKGVKVRPKSPNQKKLVNIIMNNDLTFAVGPAGTGKTFIAVALAVRALKNKAIQRIIITRPAVEAGENLGFLPGDLTEKVDPYLRPIYDALNMLLPAEKLEDYKKNNIIEIAPLAYMRGRTLDNAFVLLDEAQNTTSMQMKMFLTRLGQNSKMVITGDPSQIDLPKNQTSGLSEALYVLQNIKGIGIMHLKGEDVIRHKIVKSIIAAYDEVKN
ncbi:MAG: PhoH family protein [Cytophagales bacterium]|nr:PhoH family protein [Cytophagales bacterium]